MKIFTIWMLVVVGSDNTTHLGPFATQTDCVEVMNHSIYRGLREDRRIDCVKTRIVLDD